MTARWFCRTLGTFAAALTGLTLGLLYLGVSVVYLLATVAIAIVEGLAKLLWLIAGGKRG